MSSLSITPIAALAMQSALPPLLVPRATSLPAMSSIAGFSDARSCVRSCIDPDTASYDNIFNYVGCGTYSCVCRANVLASALVSVSSCVSNGCSEDASDQATATSIVNAYCSVTGSPDASTTANGKGNGNGDKTTITISKTVITTNGETFTSNIPPTATVVTQGSPQFENIINNNNGNGNGNAGNGNGNRNVAGSLRIHSLLAAAIGLGSLVGLVIM